MTKRVESGSGAARNAMLVSLLCGFLMLAGKLTAWLVTDSSAILSDAAESVIHVIAVAFAAFSLWLSLRPPDKRFLYGFERITFFSAGFEGLMITVAALSILVIAVRNWIAGIELSNLGGGTALVVAAGVVNAVLGTYLVRTGKRANSLILEANGRHVLTDSWTSFGVVGGLLLVIWTGWKPFDPLIAIAVGLNILWSGGRLIWQAAAGLMDYSDPETARKIREMLDALCSELGIEYHGVRFRSTGYRLIIEFHLLFPSSVTVGEAHKLATDVEERLPAVLDMPAEVITHLESLEDPASFADTALDRAAAGEV